MTPETLRDRLLAWYDANARDLPWRVGPADRGVRADPYRVWLSEVMLQQTTVPHATPYFMKFTHRWPTVSDLAGEEDGEVMAAWAGLGYYARARNLLACARAVAGDHGGVFPDTEEGLRSLPGLGPYTAAAVGAIAFDLPTNVVDGNVERVMSRLFAVETPLPDGKVELKALAGSLVRNHRPGDWAQALMDLGATVCRPKAPLCDRCPLTEFCAGLAGGEPETYPRKLPKAARPHRNGVAYILTRGGEVALVRRPPKGLLGGMLALPTSDWRATGWSDAEAAAAAPVGADWRAVGEVEHVFTHFSLTLRLLRAEGDADGVIWTPRAGLDALPSVFLKAARAGLSNLL
ncbi:A/G-specific adenine glycosylase [Phenylobacterium sp. Root77]|uniref:A/G-specific adenine glycosylase n=1 Tax=unclassified Phenylobacterium TaxID=2640670 RepID=UPI0006FD073E|nr:MULTISPECIES: A/G-specific adenine glycosylase [unclassified Phenylobacterium]KQW73098.1 A/G-specific adenine glycosylase [Phenylobacterium sp. Root1277]KQW92317.1 A/G-specific adenine glycosylase [Phenylobacterium sp. Root1290]KRC40548.1 A/G-specific adenine glycosylase [Phenylobacterium sp. Root77]